MKGIDHGASREILARQALAAATESQLLLELITEINRAYEKSGPESVPLQDILEAFQPARRGDSGDA